MPNSIYREVVLRFTHACACCGSLVSSETASDTTLCHACSTRCPGVVRTTMPRVALDTFLARDAARWTEGAANTARTEAAIRRCELQEHCSDATGVGAFATR